MGTIIFILMILFCIYMFFKKNENFIYIFVFLYPILPEYFAIKLSDSLPLLTASRCLTILLIIFTILKNKKINFKCLIETKFSRILWIFFIGETIEVFVHNNIADNVKDYFGILIENIFFTIMVTMNIDTEEKKEKCIKTLVFAAAFVFMFSIIEPFTKINVAEILDTGVSEELLKSSYERLNMKRATFSFGHPICLAVYTIMLIPLIMYCIDKYNKVIYKIIFILSICTLLLTISRGQILIGFMILAIMFISMKKDERKKYLIMILVAVMAITITCIVNKSLMNSFLNIIYSTLNTFGFNFEVKDFGENENALGRFDQFTMLPQVLDKYPIFGGGSGYIKRNKVYVYSSTGLIYKAVSIDNQYISFLINKGIFGLIYNLLLYLYLLMAHLGNKNKTKLSRALFFSILCAILSYFTVNQLTTNRIFWMIACMIIVECYQRKKKMKN